MSSPRSGFTYEISPMASPMIERENKDIPLEFAAMTPRSSSPIDQMGSYSPTDFIASNSPRLSVGNIVQPSAPVIGAFAGLSYDSKGSSPGRLSPSLSYDSKGSSPGRLSPSRLAPPRLLPSAEKLYTQLIQNSVNPMEVLSEAVSSPSWIPFTTLQTNVIRQCMSETLRKHFAEIEQTFPGDAIEKTLFALYGEYTVGDSLPLIILRLLSPDQYDVVYDKASLRL